MSVHADHAQPDAIFKQLDRVVKLVLAQQPVVDEDALQAVADCAMNQRRRDGRVDAAAEKRAQRYVAHQAALHCVDDELAHTRRGLGPGDGRHLAGLGECEGPVLPCVAGASAIEHDHAQAVPGHVDAVAHGIGAE